MKTVIVDFDNTFTLEGRDVDDLIALLYLISHPAVYVPFVCTTFGNGTLREVNHCTETVFRQLNLRIPFYSGAEKEGDVNPAAQNTAAYLAEHPGQGHRLARGRRNARLRRNDEHRDERSRDGAFAGARLRGPSGRIAELLGQQLGCSSGGATERLRAGEHGPELELRHRGRRRGQLLHQHPGPPRPRARAHQHRPQRDLRHWPRPHHLVLASGWPHPDRWVERDQHG